jgi:alanine dehydrogenase
MPGAYPRTSTIALTDATLPYALRLANEGIAALREDPAFEKGLNTYQGWLTCAGAAQALGMNEKCRELASL